MEAPATFVTFLFWDMAIVVGCQPKNKTLVVDVNTKLYRINRINLKFEEIWTKFSTAKKKVNDRLILKRSNKM